MDPLSTQAYDSPVVMSPKHTITTQSKFSIFRWRVLPLTCLGLFGQFYAYDIPGTLKDALKSHMKTDAATFEVNFSLFCAVYSFPNIILPLVCGLAIDRVGLRVAIKCLTTLVCIGSIIVCIGCYYTNWYTMLAGRTLFGIGGESLQVAQSALLFKYFKGKEVALALGINLSVARMGSSANAFISPMLTNMSGGSPILALLVGASLCMISAVCNCMSVYWEGKIGDLERDNDETNEGTEAIGNTNSTESDSNKKEDYSLKAIFSLSRSYWMLVIICVSIYGAIIPFSYVAISMFSLAFYESEGPMQATAHAGSVLAMLYTVSAFATPFFGYVVDLYGKRTILLLFAASLLTFSHASMLHTYYPSITILQMGIVYTVLAGTLWPSFALTVRDEQVGTAYGVATAIQNLGLATIPLLVGAIQATQAEKGKEAHQGKEGERLFALYGYEETEHFFTFISMCGLVVCLVLYFESPADHPLNLPSGQAEERKKQLLSISDDIDTVNNINFQKTSSKFFSPDSLNSLSNNRSRSPFDRFGSTSTVYGSTANLTNEAPNLSSDSNGTPMKNLAGINLNQNFSGKGHRVVHNNSSTEDFSGNEDLENLIDQDDDPF